MAIIKPIMKAVAIFDAPEECSVCLLADLYDDCCQLVNRDLYDYENDYNYTFPGCGKPDWCPLQIVEVNPKFASMSMELEEV